MYGTRYQSKKISHVSRLFEFTIPQWYIDFQDRSGIILYDPDRTAPVPKVGDVALVYTSGPDRHIRSVVINGIVHKYPNDNEIKELIEESLELPCLDIGAHIFCLCRATARPRKETECRSSVQATEMESAPSVPFLYVLNCCGSSAKEKSMTEILFGPDPNEIPRWVPDPPEWMSRRAAEDDD